MLSAGINTLISATSCHGTTLTGILCIWEISRHWGRVKRPSWFFFSKVLIQVKQKLCLQRVSRGFQTSSGKWIEFFWVFLPWSHRSLPCQGKFLGLFVLLASTLWWLWPNCSVPGSRESASFGRTKSTLGRWKAFYQSPSPKRQGALDRCCVHTSWSRALKVVPATGEGQCFLEFSHRSSSVEALSSGIRFWRLPVPLEGFWVTAAILLE